MNAVAAPRVERTEDGRRIYRPDGAFLAAFLMDRSPISIIRGPWGSGKSAAACQRIFQHAVEQNVDSNGQRQSRWFVMRESYPKIETTTLETWLYWFPPSLYGKLYTGSKPYRHEVRVGNIVLDVFFGAYDDLDGDSPFQSLEPTGWWWNELEHTSMRAFFSAHGRVGRWPPVIEGGSKWSGSIADLNAPGDHHWLPMLTGEVDLPDDMPLDERLAYERPAEMAYFVQPPAVLEEKGADGRVTGFSVNPKAENLKWLGEGYYERAAKNRPVSWVRKNLGNKILPSVEGDSVWPSYDEETHLSKVALKPLPGMDVYVGLDFGRRPAAVFGQRVGGQWQIQAEATMDNASASKFAPEVRNVLSRVFPSAREILIFGDPKGQDGTQADEHTAYDVFRKNGLKVVPAPIRQNHIQTRLETVSHALDRMVNGRPGLVISTDCRRLRMAMAGGYHFARERPSLVSERKPVKNRYSDIADALQYMLIGGGETRELIGMGSERRKPVSYKRQHDRRLVH